MSNWSRELTKDHSYGIDVIKLNICTANALSTTLKLKYVAGFVISLWLVIIFINKNENTPEKRWYSKCLASLSTIFGIFANLATPLAHFNKTAQQIVIIKAVYIC